jgi:CARDB/PLAT/LH2 domain
MRRLVVLTIAATLLSAAPAAAFDSGPHGDITVDALRAEGFNAPAADVAWVNNYLVDFYAQAGNNPFSGHGDFKVVLLGGVTIFTAEAWSGDAVQSASVSHFDGGALGLSDTAGVAAEWSRLQRATYKLVQGAKARRDPLDLLTAIGMSLHVVQDFYAHSNWNETTEFRGVGPALDTAKHGTTPTWFDVGDDRGAAPVYQSASDGHRGHGWWQSDFNRNLLSGMGKDWPGRPHYADAYMTGYFATRQWVQAIRTWLGDEALWAQAQRYAQNLSQLRYEVNRNVTNISTNAGRWYGEGGPCDPSISELSCGDGEGHGGTLLGLRTATKDYFEGRIGRGPTTFRRRFEQLVPGLDDDAADVTEAQVPVPSSRPIQAETRFVRLKITKIKGIDLGDVGPDDADLYARAGIAGKDYRSAVINHHDSFSFPPPYYAFTFLRPVTRGATYSPPVRTVTARIRTGDVRFAGTDDNVYLRLGPSLRFPLDKALYNDFERDDHDTYSVPIDALARRGLSLEDISQVRIEKSSDGAGGGWRLGGVKVTVNGRVLYSNNSINRWLEDGRRTWSAPGIARDHRTTAALPVWFDLRDEDSSIYGGDDQGDVNRYDNRDTVVLAYTPGTTAGATVTGGSLLGGRRSKGGDKARLSYTIDTIDPVLGALPPVQVTPLPVAEQPAPPPPPPPPPQQRPDLLFTSLTHEAFTVRNQGAAAAGPFRVTLTTSLPSTLTFDFAGLAAGASETRAYASPCATNTQAAADSLGQVAETDEANNGIEFSQSCISR